MSTTQKALIVRAGAESHEGLEELNIELERGWRVVEVAPMSGAGGATSSPIVAALVILEHEDDETAPPVEVAEAAETVDEDAEDEVEEIVEEVAEVMEGDGAGTDIPPRPRPPRKQS